MTVDFPNCGDEKPRRPHNRIAESKGGQFPVVNGKPLQSHGKKMGIRIPPQGPQYQLVVTNPTGNNFLP